MSRRWQSRRPDPGVTTDALLDAMYGTRLIVQHRPMPGCTAVCCASAVVVDLDALIWQVTVRVLTSEALAVVGTVLVLAVLAGVSGGGR